MEANDVLDRLENWLGKTKSGPIFRINGNLSAWDLDTYFALRNAAPALIRLARAAIVYCGDPDVELDEIRAILKALGEVAL